MEDDLNIFKNTLIFSKWKVTLNERKMTPSPLHTTTLETLRLGWHIIGLRDMWKHNRVGL